MISLKASRYAFVACAVLAFMLLFTTGPDRSASRWSLPKTSLTPSTPDAKSPPPNYRSASFNRQQQDTTSELGRASNATLGFEKVYVLGLEERHDKRDAIALAASLTGFHVEFFKGVRGEDVLDKAKPPGMTLTEGAMGCWRGHMNIIRSVIEHNLASVFIFEDDADWDIRLTGQMVNLAKGVRHLSGVSFTEHQHSPYGDDWDVIWPGHCGDVLPTDDDRKYLIENDETVAPKAHQPSIKGLKEYPEGTRMVHKAGAPICMFGYAVSYRGAQKILMALAVKGGESLAVDNALAYLCRDGYLDLRCYSIEPQLMHHHRPAGSVNKDSDIRGGDSKEVRKMGKTETIVLSTKLNMEQLINGSDDFVKQW